MSFLSIILLLSCKNDTGSRGDSVNRVSVREETKRSKVTAEVKVHRKEGEGFYRVILHNRGAVPIEAYGLVKQQWSSLDQEVDLREWQDSTNGHSHQYPRLAAGESYERGAEPIAWKNRLLRFGFVVYQADLEDPQVFHIWSDAVNPALDWPEHGK